MKVGVIGAGSMGSNVSRCLARKGVLSGLYNRTYEKADQLARELGAIAYRSLSSLTANIDALVIFVSDDHALREVVFKLAESDSIRGKMVINASTVTPATSLEAMVLLKKPGAVYVEAPVFGSTDEARECGLISMVSCENEVRELAERTVSLYSTKIKYLGLPPRAMATKLALNNIALAIPPIIGESLALIEAWGASIEDFLEIARGLWFGPVVERVWGRIMEEKPPRFKVELAGKDYKTISESLKAKKIHAIVADALSNAYYLASVSGYEGKDYPQVAKYYIELAEKTQKKTS